MVKKVAKSSRILPTWVLWVGITLFTVVAIGNVVELYNKAGVWSTWHIAKNVLFALIFTYSSYDFIKQLRVRNSKKA